MRKVPGAAYLLAALIIVFAIFGSGFATAANIFNIGVQSSVLLLLALPMTLIIMSEGLDLSMGAVLSLAGVVLATLLITWLNAGILLAFEGSDGSQFQLFALGGLLILSALLNAYSTRRGRGGA